MHGASVWLIGLGALYLILLIVALVLASYWPQPPGLIGAASEVGPYLFLPAPVLLALALVLRSPGAIASGVVPIVLFVALYGSRFIPPLAVREGAAEQEIVVYSANLALRQDGFAPLLSQIAATNPDVLAVQELSPEADELHEALAATLPHHVPERPRDWPGVGFWSRFPILDAETLNFDDERGNLSQRVRLDVRGQVVTFYNVHLNVPTGEDWSYDASLRRHQVEGLIADVKAQTGPVILAGDHNLTERTYDYRRLAQTLTDGYAATGWGLGHTFPAPESMGRIERLLAPYIRIDYVWTGPGVSAREVRIVDGTGSNHLALVARIAVP
jgi:vancomycin resistance protein VanJ